MINIIVESSKKAERINRILRVNGLSDDFKCYFCSGRIFDLKMSNTKKTWDIRNKDVYDFIKSVINNGNKSIIMTDSDAQGELIAYQIYELADNNIIGRTINNNLTYEGIVSSLSNIKQIDYNIVFDALRERYLAFDIYRQQIDKGQKPVSLSLMQISDVILDDVFQIEDVIEINGKMYKGRHLGLSESNTLHECRKGGGNTFDISMELAMKGMYSITNELQELYINGTTSYGRTDSNDWYKESINEIAETVESDGYYFDNSLFENHSKDNMAHSALYLLEHDILSSDITESIKSRCVDCLSSYGNSNVLHMTNGSGIKFRYSRTNEMMNANIIKASPWCSVMFHSMNLGIMKPSTLDQKTNNIVSSLFKNGKIDLNALNYVNFIKKSEFPKFNFMSESKHKTFDVNEINVDSKAMEINDLTLEQIR